jgi:cbb3-type cytochrome oxidase subunit 3
MFASLCLLTFLIFLAAKPYFACQKRKRDAAKKAEEAN